MTQYIDRHQHHDCGCKCTTDLEPPRTFGPGSEAPRSKRGRDPLGEIEAERRQAEDVETQYQWAGQELAQKLIVAQRDRPYSERHDPMDDQVPDEKRPGESTSELLKSNTAFGSIRARIVAIGGSEPAPAARISANRDRDDDRPRNER